MHQAAIATSSDVQEAPLWHPEGYRLNPHEEGHAAILQIEPEAMIPVREGEWNTFLAQMGILLLGPAAWLGVGLFGYEGTFRMGVALIIWLIVGGYGALELFLFAVRRRTRGHWRYNALIHRDRIVGSPRSGEVAIAIRDISFFTLKRQGWAVRPWLRYSVIAQLHDGQQIDLTPSIMRRKQAAEVAAVLNVWKRSPKILIDSVQQGTIWSTLALTWH